MNTNRPPTNPRTASARLCKGQTDAVEAKWGEDSEKGGRGPQVDQISEGGKMVGPSGIEAMVCGDIAYRQKLGIRKYGTTVAQSQDDMLVHAYQEALDLAVYLKAEIERRKKQAVALAALEASNEHYYNALYAEGSLAELESLPGWGDSWPRFSGAKSVFKAWRASAARRLARINTVFKDAERGGI